MQTKIFKFFIAAADAIGTFVNILENIQARRKNWDCSHATSTLTICCVDFAFLKKVLYVGQTKEGSMKLCHST